MIIAPFLFIYIQQKGGFCMDKLDLYVKGNVSIENKDTKATNERLLAYANKVKEALGEKQKEEE